MPPTAADGARRHLHARLSEIVGGLRFRKCVESTRYEGRARLEIQFVGLNKREFEQVRDIEAALERLDAGTAGVYNSIAVSCSEYHRLLQEQWEATDRWRDLLRKLSEAAMSREAAMFQTVWEQTSKAQKEYATARAAVAAHAAAHHCG
jgi:hypothetical protein